MNTWQIVRQMQYLLQNQNWTGSSNNVFAETSVMISAAPREEIAEKVRLPLVIIAPGAATVDDEYPDYVEQEIVVTLAVGHAGDAVGEFPMVGGHRTSQTRSIGRGLLEVEEEMFNAIELLNTDDGVVVQLRMSSAPSPDYVGGQYLLFRDYLLRANLTADRFYHPVINLQES